MLPIPAIDLLDGRCVRLRQGDYEQATVFSDEPVEVALRWVEQGAKWLHLVDLDGARAGRPINDALVARIVRQTGVPCQLGGGLRSAESIRQALDLRVARVVIGTQAVRDPNWFGEMAQLFAGRLVLALDAKDGRVAVEGWQNMTALSARDVAGRYQDLPLAAVIYTDIQQDGMLTGPNFDAICELAQCCRHPVIAAGGIASVEHVLELQRRGIGACILGRSLYQGIINFSELVRQLAQQPQHESSQAELGNQ